MAKRNLNLSKLPSNSLSPREKEKPVVTGKAKKRSGGGLARDLRNVGNSLFGDVVMPALKSLALDFINQAGEQMLFKGDRRPGRGAPTAYNRPYRERKKTHGARKKQQNRYVEEIEEVFENVYYEHREDAERVLGRMMERVAEYGTVRVADLESLSGFAPEYTHDKWGWDDLTGVRVIYTNGGFVITLPEPMYLD